MNPYEHTHIAHDPPFKKVAIDVMKLLIIFEQSLMQLLYSCVSF